MLVALINVASSIYLLPLQEMFNSTVVTIKIATHKKKPTTLNKTILIETTDLDKSPL